MYDVGDLRADLRARPDHRMTHYRNAHLLARQLITAQLRTPTHGDALAWTFLVRTPDLIEEGLRRILVDGLAPEWHVAKTGIQLAGTKLRLQPDLVFDGDGAVADIKYKLYDGSWNRPDLYQVTTFATGYQTSRGALLNFDDRQDVVRTPPLTIGTVKVDVLSWNCAPRRTPRDSAKGLIDDVRNWLTPAA